MSTFGCGHDKTPENSKPKKDGRGRMYAQCRTCYNAQQRRRKLRRAQEAGRYKPMPTEAERAIRLPAQPLLDFVRHRTLTPQVEDAARRAKVDGNLTLIVADKVACSLGTHPALIWPEWFEVGA